jgi:autotransporter-associated beta strand protein
LEKSGTAKLTLSGANTYTGNTTISGGTLALTGSGSIAESAIINVHSGSKFNVTGVTSSATVGASTAQTLKGLGTVEIGSKILNIGANGTLAPGASLGTLTFDVATGGALNFASGSDIAFELGTTGSGNSDIISFSSAGDWLQGTANATLALTLLSGFDYSNTYTIFENVTTTGFTLAGVNGYDKVGYTHTFAQSGNNYQLSFAPVPETSTTLLSLLGSLALLRRRRRN